jgi:hypothetical protein
VFGMVALASSLARAARCGICYVVDSVTTATV